MVDLSATILAASQAAGEGGSNNFLLPNGTFFFVLLIFLIVLGVIGVWVVPPISKVLREREAMVTKTAEDNRKIAEQLAAADTDYQKTMSQARSEASAIRDKARGEGRQVVEEMRGRASEESANTLKKAGEELSRQGKQTAEESAVLGGIAVGHAGQPGAGRRCQQRAVGGHDEPGTVTDVDIHRYTSSASRSSCSCCGDTLSPPVRRMMTSRQEAVRTQLEQSAAATEKLEKPSPNTPRRSTRPRPRRPRWSRRRAPTPRRSASSCAPRPTPRSSGSRCKARQQVELLRAQLIRELRANLGTESVQRAGNLVRDHVSDDQNRSATVDRFLDELDEMAPSSMALEGDDVAGARAARMRSASRDSLRALVGRFDELTADLNPDGLSELADDLASVAELLTDETVLTRHLAEPVDDSGPKVSLVEALLSGKIGDDALEVLKSAVSQRWSEESDLHDAVVHLARRASVGARGARRPDGRGRRPAVPVRPHSQFRTPAEHAAR